MPWWNRDHENCIVCGASLRDKRGDAKFCGATCRKKWSRRKDDISAAAANVSAGIWELRRCGKDYADLRGDVVAQLRRLRTEIDDVLLMYDPEKQRDVAEKNEMLIGVSNRRNLYG